MKEVEIYSLGITSCSVCADKKLSSKSVERIVNELSPTMIASKWKISKDKTFRTGETNPCVCENDLNRLHYLMNC